MHREVSLGTRDGETMVIKKINKTIIGSRIVFNLMVGCNLPPSFQTFVVSQHICPQRHQNTYRNYLS